MNNLFIPNDIFKNAPYEVAPSVQPVQSDFFTDGTSEISAKSDHQHPLSTGLLAQLGLSGGGSGIAFGTRNLLDNGQHEINQRNITSAVMTSGSVQKIADRWAAFNKGVGSSTLGWSTMGGFGVNVPTGRPRPAHLQYIVMTTAEAAAALTTDDDIVESINIEGLNIQHLNWGLPEAKPVTLSFDCYSTVAATYVAELNTSLIAGNRTIGKLFTVVPGFQTVSITFPGDTVNIIDNDNNARLALTFFFTAGPSYTSSTLQTSWGTLVNANRAAGISNTFQATLNNIVAVTNVQLEVGSVATPYEVRRFNDELQTCLRYYERITAGTGGAGSIGAGGQCYAATNAEIRVPFTVIKRAVPTLINKSAAATFGIWGAAAALIACTAIGSGTNSLVMGAVRATVAAGLVAGNVTLMFDTGTNTTFLDFSCEI